MIFSRAIIFLWVVRLCASLQLADAGTESAARDLMARIIPAQAENFTVGTIAAEKGQDVFEIESPAGKIILHGNHGVSIVSALKRYRADFCHADPGWVCGSQMIRPATYAGCG